MTRNPWMICGAAVIALGWGARLQASAFFDFVGDGSTPSLISYTGPGGNLVDSSNVTLIEDPSNPAADQFPILNGTLFFTSGTVQSSAGSQVTFAPQGLVTITGAIPGLGIPDVVKLFEGSFSSPVVASLPAPTDTRQLGSVTGNLDASYVDDRITNHFGAFSKASSLATVDHFANPPANPFQSGFSGSQASAGLSVPTAPSSNIPEPATGLIWAAGVAGLGGLMLRKRIAPA